ncbi:TetR/AcrR family transcriptional regulator [Sphingobium yanoikuyae]|uniref:TetR/AcrR family transcriptional regulator n=1 Tax=Sphingobium yanoikuyae TaxID=13690 RepID=UPI0024201776|nr:TetR/AcrR family transcriptional regulator [Sphingobium yanoikuyae]
MAGKKTLQESPATSDSRSRKLSDTESHSFQGRRSSSRTDPRQVRSAQALRQALLQLLAVKSFDQITIREICETAHVHYATFFRHHNDKEGMLDHVAKEEIDRLVAFSLPAGHRLEGYRALCDYVHSHRGLWRALLTGGAGGAMREELMRLSKNLAGLFQEYRSWLPQELSIICSTTLIVETLSWWLTQEESAYSSDQIAVMLDELVESAVIAPRPRAR